MPLMPHEFQIIAESLQTMARKSTDYIVVHCSWTNEFEDIGAAEIDRWHRGRGWLMIGYHFVIRRDGGLEKGRSLDDAGAHVKGYNQLSVAVCMVGGKDINGGDEINYTDEQWDALQRCVAGLLQVYPDALVVGHHDLYEGKTCPIFDVKAWAEENRFPTLVTD